MELAILLGVGAQPLVQFDGRDTSIRTPSRVVVLGPFDEADAARGGSPDPRAVRARDDDRADPTSWWPDPVRPRATRRPQSLPRAKADGFWLHLDLDVLSSSDVMPAVDYPQDNGPDLGAAARAADVPVLADDRLLRRRRDDPQSRARPRRPLRRPGSRVAQESFRRKPRVNRLPSGNVSPYQGRTLGGVHTCTQPQPTATGATKDHAKGTALRRVLAGSVVGTALEWYDFFIYGTAAALVFGDLFFTDKAGSGVGTLAAFATFGVGFVVRPLGGILFGQHGRPHRPPRDADRHDAADGHLDRRHRPAADLRDARHLGADPAHADARLPGPRRRRRVRRRLDAAGGARAHASRRGFYGSFSQLGVQIGLRARHRVVPARQPAARRTSSTAGAGGCRSWPRS